MLSTLPPSHDNAATSASTRTRGVWSTDQILGVVITGLSLGCYLTLPSQDWFQGTGMILTRPEYFPQFILLGLALAGLVLTIQSSLSLPMMVLKPTRSHLSLGSCIPIAIAFFYVFCFTWGGYILSTTSSMALFMIVLGERRWLYWGGIPLMMTLLLRFMALHALNILLP